jgi:hypothetical protein
MRRADYSSKESYCLWKNDYGAEEEARDQQMSIEPLISEWIHSTAAMFFLVS